MKPIRLILAAMLVWLGCFCLPVRAIAQYSDSQFTLGTPASYTTSSQPLQVLPDRLNSQDYIKILNTGNYPVYVLRNRSSDPDQAVGSVLPGSPALYLHIPGNAYVISPAGASSCTVTPLTLTNAANPSSTSVSLSTTNSLASAQANAAAINAALINAAHVVIPLPAGSTSCTYWVTIGNPGTAVNDDGQAAGYTRGPFLSPGVLKPPVIQLQSGNHLTIEKGVTLKAWQYTSAPLIGNVHPTTGDTDITVDGQGTLDNNGKWDCYGGASGTDPGISFSNTGDSTLQNVGATAGNGRVYTQHSAFSGPSGIAYALYDGKISHFYRITGLKIENVRFINGGKFACAIYNCSNVSVRNVTLRTGNDGIDLIGSASNVLIDGVYGFSQDNPVAFLQGETVDSWPATFTFDGSGNVTSATSDAYTCVVSNVTVRNIFVSTENSMVGVYAHGLGFSGVTISNIFGRTYQAGASHGVYFGCDKNLVADTGITPRLDDVTVENVFTDVGRPNGTSTGNGALVLVTTGCLGIDNSTRKVSTFGKVTIRNIHRTVSANSSFATVHVKGACSNLTIDNVSQVGTNALGNNELVNLENAIGVGTGSALDTSDSVRITNLRSPDVQNMVKVSSAVNQLALDNCHWKSSNSNTSAILYATTINSLNPTIWQLFMTNCSVFNGTDTLAGGGSLIIMDASVRSLRVSNLSMQGAASAIRSTTNGNSGLQTTFTGCHFRDVRTVVDASQGGEYQFTGCTTSNAPSTGTDQVSIIRNTAGNNTTTVFADGNDFEGYTPGTYSSATTGLFFYSAAGTPVFRACGRSCRLQNNVTGLTSVAGDTFQMVSAGGTFATTGVWGCTVSGTPGGTGTFVKIY